jgi:hypothetical protein
MLDYTYLILQKLSFNNDLFKKELKKCITYLNQEEVNLLRNWVENHFEKEYSEDLYICFS